MRQKPTAEQLLFKQHKDNKNGGIQDMAAQWGTYLNFECSSSFCGSWEAFTAHLFGLLGGIDAFTKKQGSAPEKYCNKTKEFFWVSKDTSLIERKLA